MKRNTHGREVRRLKKDRGAQGENEADEEMLGGSTREINEGWNTIESCKDCRRSETLDKLSIA